MSRSSPSCTTLLLQRIRATKWCFTRRESFPRNPWHLTFREKANGNKNMELSLSGNALKSFARSITCLARVGNELALQASPTQLAFHTLNPSRSAYQCITFKPDFFDIYSISSDQVQCSVLLKAVCSALRTSAATIDHLRVHLPDSDASKLQWVLECYNGMRKTYWITCNVEPDIQHLSLDRRRFPSNLVVRPRDFNRLLANFQSSLQEITVIATNPSSLPSDVANEIGGKAVELRSYIDPTKDDSDTALHTQLWIDPTEEFLQYTHTGDPVDVTFGVKELKAFISFCEGCEVDIHIFFEKAGEPILMAPKFGLDDGSDSNFDAALVLATMLVSQLHDGNPFEHTPTAATSHVQADQRAGSGAEQERPREAVPEHPSDHTRIWSELSGSAAKSGGGIEERQVPVERTPGSGEQREMQRINMMEISDRECGRRNVPDGPVHRQTNQAEPQDRDEGNANAWSQHHPSNWVDADEDEDEGDEGDLCVQSTPPY